MPSHYEILGVEENVSLSTIKKAFCRIQLECHPDKTQGLEKRERKRREAISKAANTAWETLSDEKAKDKYDERLQWFRPVPADHDDEQPRAKKPKQRKPWRKAAPRPRVPTNFTAYAYYESHVAPDPDLFVWNDNGWSFEMRTSPRCRSVGLWEEDGERVRETEDGIFIMTRLGDVPMFPGQTDVTISVTPTPNSQKISEIRSCFLKTNNNGVKETVLYLKIVTSNITHGDTLPKWEFAWNVIPANIVMKIPEDAQNWAVYFTFHTKEPETETPWQYIQHFEELHSVLQVELEELEYTKMAYGLDKDMYHIHRLAGAAYMAF